VCVCVGVCVCVCVWVCVCVCVCVCVSVCERVSERERGEHCMFWEGWGGRARCMSVGGAGNWLHI
jgi:hypothetical protein